MQKYTFKMHEPGSLLPEDMEYCSGMRKVDLKPVDDKFRFLFILGAQKAGTTWLHQALRQHPIFTQADEAYMYVIMRRACIFLFAPWARDE